MTSAALLDITNKRAVEWLKVQLKKLVQLLGDDLAFYVDGGNTFHTPTYFEVSILLSAPLKALFS